MAISPSVKAKWQEEEKRKMSRKTDAEVMAEMKVQEAEKRLAELKSKAENSSEEGDDDIPDMNKMLNERNQENQENPEVQPQIIEREINLSLINDKLNFIISKFQEK